MWMRRAATAVAVGAAAAAGAGVRGGAVWATPAAAPMPVGLPVAPPPSAAPSSSSSAPTPSTSSASASATPPCGVCTDFRKWTGGKAGMATQSSGGTPGRDGNAAGAAGTRSLPNNMTAGPTSTAAALSTAPLPCPPDRGALGRGTWTFLHTAAAYYPAAPTPAEQASMARLITEVALWFPCHYCAEHMRTYLHEHPVDAASSAALSLWLCRMHNEVNGRLGKPTFDCARVGERWKDGPPEGTDCVEGPL